MPIQIKRIFEPLAGNDGYRILVDRLWPRGISKEDAKLDDWKKEVAPSDELRKRFHMEKLGWGDFRNRYLRELKAHRKDLRQLVSRSKHGQITLLYSAKDAKHNNAVVLKQYLSLLGAD